MVVEVQSYSSLSSIPHLSTFSAENIDIQVTKENRHKSLKAEKTEQAHSALFQVQKATCYLQSRQVHRQKEQCMC